MFEEELDALQSRDDSKVAASVERLLAADTGIAFGADPTQLTYRQLVDLCWSYEWSIARIEACQLAVIAEQLRRALSAGASQVEAQQRCALDVQGALHISQRAARSLVATAQEICDHPGSHAGRPVAPAEPVAT
ncbi:hypothetical protein GCM10009765_29710 [Fodinicola feengrottensis]|uniref:Uncharacterized protein n=1 Tax=Fodinicola feengrottensis TaxID=435914 RepID=A0ABN2GXI9_9ACTN